MADPDVDAWLPAAARGDGVALDQIVRAYRPAVYRYCRSRLWDHETAEDVTQEVVLAMVQALPRHRSETHTLGAFVFGIAANHVAQAYRTRAKVAEVADDLVPDRIDETAGPEDLAVTADEIGHVMLLVDELPESYREIVMLRVAAGLSAAEVAEVLGMSPGAVRVAQFRALTRLRELALAGAVS